MTRLLKKRLQQREDGERGIALIAVVGIMAVLMVVSATVLSSSATSAGFATSTRADVQSSAAANSGIEAVLAQLDTGNFICSLVSDAGTSPKYSVTVSYTSSSGSAIACSGSTAASIPATATVTSVGTADSVAVAKVSNRSTSTLAATIAIQVTPGGISLTDAIFTNGTLNLNNNDVINQSASGALDGNIYSNNAINCAAGGTVDGTIYTQNSVNLTNSNCVAYGTIWSGGSVVAGSTSGVQVKGSIYAVGSIQTGTAPILGSLIAGTSVTLGQANSACPSGGSSESVCGSVYALGGAVSTDQNGSRVAGSLYAKGSIAGTNNAGQMTVGGDVISTTGSLTGYMTVAGNAKATGSVSTGVTVGSGKTKCAGTSCAATLPLTTAASPAFVAPSTVFNPSNTTNAGTATTTVGVAAPPVQYTPQLPTGTSSWLSAGWKIYVAPSAWCSTSNGALGTDIAGIYHNYPAGSNLLIDFSTCSGAPSDSNLSIAMATANVTNLALYLPHGISIQNGTTINSADNNVHTLYLVAPSNASGVSWSGTNNATPTCTGSGPNFNFNSVTNNQKTQIFVYTPCTLTMTNGGTLVGQFYTGNASFPTSMVLTIPVAGNLAVVPGMTIPGGATSATTQYSASVISRYVVSG